MVYLDRLPAIAKGGLGFVYKANYRNKTVVIKKITSESSSDENLFLKEAKLINSLRHANVVGFMGLCTLPCAIMLEYVAFDFSRFGHSKHSTNLGDFPNSMDRIDGFENFNDKLHAKVFSDVAVGLAYLHDKDTAHRDLKPKNILVSNQHYCDIKEDDQRWAAFEKALICQVWGNTLQTDSVFSTLCPHEVEKTESV